MKPQRVNFEFIKVTSQRGYGLDYLVARPKTFYDSVVRYICIKCRKNKIRSKAKICKECKK